MRILILSKKTGIGNQIQFIPVIDHLKASGHNVYSDSSVFHTLHVAEKMQGRYQRIYIPFGYNWLQVLLICLKYPFTPKYGYKYRIRGINLSFGYKKAYKFYHDESEIEQNVIHFGGEKRYLPTLEKEKYTVIHYTERPDRGLGEIVYKKLLNHLEKVVLVGERPKNDYLRSLYIPTPTFNDLVEVVKKAERYAGPDSGVMHLADYFNCKCLVFFGPTSAKKSGCVNGVNIQSHLDCSPCYKWGKVRCTKYRCLKDISI